MIIEGETVIFKSDLDMFIKEQRGIKPNTIRHIPDSEHNEWIDFLSHNGTKHIQIGCYGEDFTRTITDISHFRGYWIISWNPNEVEA